MIEKLADIPLRHQPGSVWHYSVAVDVQGYLVEVLSGQPFDAFLKERIFKPLGMTDTAFWVTEDKASRFAQVYVYGEDGQLELPQAEPLRDRDYLTPAKFLSGGGGLVSTSEDYMRFCQMLLNGGELDGVRLLAPLHSEAHAAQPTAEGPSGVLPRPRLRVEFRRGAGPGGGGRRFQG